MKKYQQGDVILNMVSNIPNGAVEVRPVKRRYVLAEGETSGHAHVLDAIPTTKMFNYNNKIFMSLMAPQKIKHEEHKEIQLPAGNYKIGIVREVDPFTDEIKNVKD